MPKRVIKNWFIYKIANPAGMIYVGRTGQPKERKKYHLTPHPNWKGYKNPLIVDSINKYGSEAHSFEIIDQFSSDIEYANGKEIFWIKTFLSNRNEYPERQGMNLTNGGFSLKGYKHTDEAKEAIKKGHLGKKHTNSHREAAATAQWVPILMYDNKGVKLKQFSSIKAAQDHFGLSSNARIWRVLKNKDKEYKGFVFKYQLT